MTSPAMVTFAPSKAIPEGSSYAYGVDLFEPDGVTPVDPSQVTDILLTLRDASTHTIINGRSQQSVLNQNGGTLTVGRFVMQFASVDMIQIGTREFEARRLTLDFLLAGGGRATREISFWLQAMDDIV